MNRHYLLLTVNMYHIESSDSQELESIRKGIEDFLKEKYPCAMFDSDIEVEIDMHSGACNCEGVKHSE